MGDEYKISFVLIGIILSGFFVGISEAKGASFQGLGDLVGGDYYSNAYDISSDGSVVAGYSKSTASGTLAEAFRWTDSNGMTGLGDLSGGSFNSRATAISGNGLVIVGRGTSASGPLAEAFRWTDSNGIVGLGDLAGSNFYSYAQGVSSDGAVVAGYSKSTASGSNYEAFRWTDSNGMVGLGDLTGGSFNSLAYGISSNSLVIVGRGESASGTEAFRWTDSNGMVGLGDLAGSAFDSRAYGVSADGAVVVGYSKSTASGSNYEAFRWTQADGMVGLGDLPGGDFNSRAYAVSADGLVVVGYGNSASDQEVFIWDANNGMQSLKDLLENKYDLDLTGWTLDNARGISDDGSTIVGYGNNPSAQTEAWIAKLQGAVYNVDAVNGDDSNDGWNRETAFATIQKGIDTAEDGDTVIVWPGLYLTPNESSPEEINFNGKNIVLTSADPNDANVVNNTVIRGIVQFDGTEDVNCVFRGFTVRDLYNGAIYGNDTYATISHCVISGNGACRGTVIENCHGTISNCLIADNIDYWECGIPLGSVVGCHGVIKNCTITNNSPSGGVAVLNGGTTTIENCIIYDNVADEIGVASGAVVNISYSDVEGGLGGVTGSGTVNWGPGNIDSDPCFVQTGYWETYELFEGDYHLKSEGWVWHEYFPPPTGPSWTWYDVTSRCIDAGNPGCSLTDELMSVPRDPNNDYGENLRINMGVYGGTNQASMAPYDWALLADLNNDGTVDFVDFAEQANDWLVNAAELPGDLNRDVAVNTADLGSLCDDWLKTTDWW